MTKNSSQTAHENNDGQPIGTGDVNRVACLKATVLSLCRYDRVTVSQRTERLDAVTLDLRQSLRQLHRRNQHDIGQFAVGGLTRSVLRVSAVLRVLM